MDSEKPNNPKTQVLPTLVGKQTIVQDWNFPKQLKLANKWSERIV